MAAKPNDDHGWTSLTPMPKHALNYAGNYGDGDLPLQSNATGRDILYAGALADFMPQETDAARHPAGYRTRNGGGWI